MSIDEITQEEIDTNKEKVVKLLRDTQRQGVEELITWLDETDFYTAPASSRVDYHGCYKGGLVQHSLNVYEVFAEKVERFGLDVKDDEVVISALLHDLCKVDIYKENVLTCGKISEKKPYVIQEEEILGHGDKSCIMAERCMELMPTERMLIRWHMGAYDPAWEQYGQKVQKVCPAITAFHHADNEASKYLD